MRPSSLGGGRIMRRTLSVRLSVCPSVPLSLLPSVTSRHLANHNDTRTEGRITAISAAQACFGLNSTMFKTELHFFQKYTVSQRVSAI